MLFQTLTWTWSLPVKLKDLLSWDEDRPISIGDINKRHLMAVCNISKKRFVFTN